MNARADLAEGKEKLVDAAELLHSVLHPGDELPSPRPQGIDSVAYRQLLEVLRLLNEAQDRIEQGLNAP